MQMELNRVSCPAGSKLQKQPSMSRDSVGQQAAAAWAAARRRQDSCISDIFWWAGRNCCLALNNWPVSHGGILVKRELRVRELSMSCA